MPKQFPTIPPMQQRQAVVQGPTMQIKVEDDMLQNVIKKMSSTKAKGTTGVSMSIWTSIYHHNPQLLTDLIHQIINNQLPAEVKE